MNEAEKRPARILPAEGEEGLYSQTRRWYDSPEYAAARTLREETADGRFILVKAL